MRCELVRIAEQPRSPRCHSLGAREERIPESKLSVNQFDKRRCMRCGDVGVGRDVLERPNPPGSEQGLERMFDERVEQIEQLEPFDQLEGVIPQPVLETQSERGSDPLIVVLDIELREQVIAHEGMELRELGTWAREARLDRLVDDRLLVSAESGFDEFL
jgi:hypothetical protein